MTASRALGAFCAATTVFLVARDVFVPEVRDVEVWFGVELRGRAAIATAPLHWLLFAAASVAFFRDRTWVWKAAAAYSLYIAASHVVWNFASPSGGGAPSALAQGVLFALPAPALLVLGRRARRVEGIPR